MKEKIISYQTDDDNVCLHKQETYSFPHGAVLVTTPEITDGNVAIWKTTLSKLDLEFGKEGTGQWEVKQDNRKADLYHGKEKYEIGSEVDGQSYDGIGDIPEWLSTEPTPDTPEEIALRAQQQTNREARAYLASTDWYVIRQQENGTPIPQDILDARQAARDSIIEVGESNA